MLRFLWILYNFLLYLHLKGPAAPMEQQSLITIYVTGQTHHVDGATNAPPVLLLTWCSGVVDGGLKHSLAVRAFL